MTAIVLTALALAVLNVAIAYLIVLLAGLAVFIVLPLLVERLISKKQPAVIDDEEETLVARRH